MTLFPRNNTHFFIICLVYLSSAFVCIYISVTQEKIPLWNVWTNAREVWLAFWKVVLRNIYLSIWLWLTYETDYMNSQLSWQITQGLQHLYILIKKSTNTSINERTIKFKKTHAATYNKNLWLLLCKVFWQGLKFVKNLTFYLVMISVSSCVMLCRKDPGI